MRSRWWVSGVVLVAMLAGLAGSACRAGSATAVEPITYIVRFSAPDKHVAEVEASYPTDGRAAKSRWSCPTRRTPARCAAPGAPAWRR